MSSKKPGPDEFSSKVEQYIYREYRLDPEYPIVAFLRDHFQFPPEPGTITWLHFHNFLEIMYCYEERIINIENRIYSISPGSICVIPPNQMHNSRSAGFSPTPETHGCEYMYLDPERLLGDFFTETYSFQKIFEQINGTLKNVISPSENPIICRLTSCILEEMRRPRSNQKYLVRGLLLSFWIELMRTLELPSVSYLAKRRELTEVYPAMAYIREHYAQKIQTDTLAELCHMSPSQFRENFRKSTGMSPRKYIDDLRLSRSCQLLRGTELGILAIALQCGYNSLSNYNSHFTAKYGTSPTNWKKAQRNIKKKSYSHSIYQPPEKEDAGKPV